MKPTYSIRTVVCAVVALALLAGIVTRQAAAQARIDLDVKRAVVRIVPERSTAAGPRLVEDQPGSGVIIHPSGIVLTAWHVLSQDDNTSQRTYWDDFVVEVIEDDDSSPPVARYRAKIIAVRPEDDLALLRLDRRLNRQPLTPDDLTTLAYLPVFTETGDNSGLLDPGNTELRVLGYPKPFATSGEESELYIEPATLSSRSASRGELIVQETFDAGYSGGPVLVEADGRLAVAGIVLSARGSRTVLRDLAERFRGFEWMVGEQSAFAQNVRVTEVVEGNDRTLQFDLDVQSIGLEGAPVQLQINFYDADHRPWRPGAVGLSLRTDGSVYWEEDIRPDRPVAAYPVQVRFSLASLGVTDEKLTFRLMLYDKSTNRQLWSDVTWYQAQPAAVAQADPSMATSTRTPTPTIDPRIAIEAGARATLTARASTAVPTSTPTRPLPTPTATSTADAQLEIAAAVNATLTALAPTAAPTRTPTSTPTATATPNAAATFQAAVNATLTAIAPTPTPTPTPGPTPAESAAGTKREIDGITFVYVPAGEFVMGSPAGEGESNEHPQHTVRLDGYWMGKTEVTNTQYARCVEARACPAPDNTFWNDRTFAEHPVTHVSWDNAVAYSRWLTEKSGVVVRLPSEAEWEKAARGTNGRIYPWGSDWDGGRLNYCDSNCEYDWADKDQDDGYQYTAPVGSYADGVSPYGAHDMAGNVWEWVQDRYSDGYYAASPRRNPQGPDSGDSRVLRSGAWLTNSSGVRSAFRGLFGPSFRGYGLGFRLVAPDLSQPEMTVTPPVQLDAVVNTTSTPTPRLTPTADEPAAGATRLIEGIPFVYVPAGEFTMGSSDADVQAAVTLCLSYQSDCAASRFADEQPQHSVYVDGFWVMRTEVTNAQYGQFVSTAGYETQRFWSADGWEWRTSNGVTTPEYWANALYNDPNQPVVGVSWYEATAYARWLAERRDLAIRLPSEAEWEKAARGRTDRIFPWGNTWNPSLANYCDLLCDEQKDKALRDGFVNSAPVGSYPNGASPYGVVDMAGNSWEWVADVYNPGYYAESHSHNPIGVEGSADRSMRGGSWRDAPRSLRLANRGNNLPESREQNIGFRLIAVQPTP